MLLISKCLNGACDADYLQSGGARPEEFALGFGHFSGLESATKASLLQACQLST
jgi:hypothetical protein